MISFSANAQFSNTKTRHSVDNGPKGWNKVYVSYDPIVIHTAGDWNYMQTGLSLGYSRTSALTRRIPLKIEYGAALNYCSGTVPTRTEMGSPYNTRSAQVIALTVPVNLLYNFSVSENFALAPYVGLRARTNLLDLENDKISDIGMCRRFALGCQAGMQIMIAEKFSISGEYDKFFGEEYYEEDRDPAWGFAISIGYIF